MKFHTDPISVLSFKLSQLELWRHRIQKNYRYVPRYRVAERLFHRLDDPSKMKIQPRDEARAGRSRSRGEIETKDESTWVEEEMLGYRKYIEMANQADLFSFPRPEQGE